MGRRWKREEANKQVKFTHDEEFYSTPSRGLFDETDPDSKSEEVVRYLGCKDGIEYAEVAENSHSVIVEFLRGCFPRSYWSYIDSYFKLQPLSPCLQATDDGVLIGCVVYHIDERNQGNIAYLAVECCYRKMGIASNLLQFAIDRMITANEIVLQTEVNNRPSIQLYEKFGFKRGRVLARYYPNGIHAVQMKLLKKETQQKTKSKVSPKKNERLKENLEEIYRK